ncbi:O-antigen ligase [Microbacterium endophyticum]|uniref:O-antigen ligase n=1 Tax=Microbacterium endophyticum TaxID=1526412 RepID=A0A7W4YNM5_9MICO|nr:O-antigen ligase family protein [Microbacterium endophyticum]MBB2976327.1 O-antigen ligase [Microbacterium endophyticum]NIK35207.1 O-antigen ligase [Microbacterium endophyticum]
MSGFGGTPASLRFGREFFRSAAIARAFTLTTLGTAFGMFAIEHVAGRICLITIIVGLCLLGAAILWARSDDLELPRLVPLSVLAFVVWALASTIWTHDTTETIVGWLALAALAFLGIVAAHVRDTLQMVRALGDVLRLLLAISLGIEILSGILLDTPIAFLGVEANIAAGGPIQGLFGTRNALGFVAVIALIAFMIEWRTSSVRSGVAIGSVVLAGVLAVLSDSPTVVVLGVAVGAAALILMLVRHTASENRNVLQWTLGAIVAVGLAVTYALRHQIIAFLGAGSDFSTRVDLWNTIEQFVRIYPVQGWGWMGPWLRNQAPFNAINYVEQDHHASALNAFVDVVLQLGWVGLALFVLLAGIALVRSWLVASVRRSVVYAWTPLVVIALTVDSLFESFTLSGFGWLLLVICAVRAGQSRSWRQHINDEPGSSDLPAAHAAE